MALFDERGYEEVAIGQIAAAAGVSVPTFYAHYAGKDELIMALPARCSSPTAWPWRWWTDQTPRAAGNAPVSTGSATW